MHAPSITGCYFTLPYQTCPCQCLPTVEAFCYRGSDLLNVCVWGDEVGRGVQIDGTRPELRRMREWGGGWGHWGLASLPGMEI
jgi:hypothetical protein